MESACVSTFAFSTHNQHLVVQWLKEVLAELAETCLDRVVQGFQNSEVVIDMYNTAARIL